jgi:hypothetical protein
MKKNTALSPSATSFPVVGAPPCERMCELIHAPSPAVSTDIRRRKGHADAKGSGGRRARGRSTRGRTARARSSGGSARTRRGREAQEGLREDHGGYECAAEWAIADATGAPTRPAASPTWRWRVPGVVAFRLPGKPQSNLLPPIRALRPISTSRPRSGRGALEALPRRHPDPLSREAPGRAFSPVGDPPHEALRWALNRAVRLGMLDRNPCDGVEPPRAPRSACSRSTGNSRGGSWRR